MGFLWKVSESCFLQNQNGIGYFYVKWLLGMNAMHLNFNICCCFWVSQLCSSWLKSIWPASPNDAQHKVVWPCTVDLRVPALQRQKKIAMKLNKVLKVKISLLRSMKRFFFWRRSYGPFMLIMRLLADNLRVMSPRQWYRTKTKWKRLQYIN